MNDWEKIVRRLFVIVVSIIPAISFLISLHSEYGLFERVPLSMKLVAGDLTSIPIIVLFWLFRTRSAPDD